MNNLKLLTSAFISCSIIFSCGNHSKKSMVLRAITYKKLKLESTSAYEITIPDYYNIKKRQGPDFDVYLISTSTSNTTQSLPYGGIYFGGAPQKIAPMAGTKLKKDTSISGLFLGRKINWTIYGYDSLLSAQTIINQGDYLKIHSFIYATNYSQLDTLIKVMELLSKYK